MTAIASVLRLLALALPVLALPVTAVAQTADPWGGADDPAGGVSLAGDPGGDYDLTSTAWNGLASFEALARGMGLQVEARREFDWDDLEADDILVVLYSRNRIEPSHLAGFLRNGGRVLLADDFGDTSETLGRLGMLRASGVGVAADAFYDDLAFAPIARPLAPDHSIAEGVDQVITNHPAVLTNVSGPEVIFGFGSDAAVVVAGALGDGRFVVLGDPSVFINRMLQFPGNLQLTVNIIRFLSRGRAPGLGSRRLVVLAGDFLIFGEPDRSLDDGTVSGTVASMLGDLDDWLEERNDYLLTPVGLRAVGVLLALVLGLMALAALPVLRRQKLDGSWTRAQDGHRIPDDVEALCTYYDKNPSTGNYLVPATIIRDTVNRALAQVLEQPEPLFTMRRDDLLGALAERRGTEAARALDRIQGRLRPLPSRMQAASSWSTAFLSRRDFERLERDAEELYRKLGTD